MDLVEATLVTVRFLGCRTRVAPKLAAILARVESALHAEWQRAQVALPGGAPTQTFAEWHSVRSCGGYRKGGGWHGHGLAIDLNYHRNGYSAVATHTRRGLVYGGESGGDFPGVRKAFIAACGRACAAAGVLCDLSARRAGESTASVWDRWHVVSEAVRAYLAPYFPAVDDLDAGEADVLPGVVIPAQVAEDYQALRVPLVVNNPARTPRLTRNPAKGLMDLRRAVVVALCDVGGMRWGACDFGAKSSGDLMHLDTASRIPSGAV